jgi:branched-chain amino acid transport system permease protein
MVLTALPEVLRALAGVGGLPDWLAQFLQNGRLIIFGLLIVLSCIFYSQGLITPDLLRRFSWKSDKSDKSDKSEDAK